MISAISAQEAEKLIAAAIAGSQLDEVRFSNSYVLMIFFNWAIERGNATRVHLEFYGPADDPSIECSLRNYAERRSRFLANLYKKIGNDASEVSIGEGGELHIQFGESTMCVLNEGPPYATDDFLWQVRIERAPAAPEGEGTRAISCVVDEECVSYYLATASGDLSR